MHMDSLNWVNHLVSILLVASHVCYGYNGPSSDVQVLASHFHPLYAFNTSFHNNSAAKHDNNHKGSSSDSSNTNGSQYTLLIVGIICVVFVILAAIVVRFRRYKERQLLIEASIIESEFKSNNNNPNNNNIYGNEASINNSDLNSINNSNNPHLAMDRSYTASLILNETTENNTNENNESALPPQSEISHKSQKSGSKLSNLIENIKNKARFKSKESKSLISNDQFSQNNNLNAYERANNGLVRSNNDANADDNGQFVAIIT